MNFHLFSYIFPRTVNELRRNSTAQQTWLKHKDDCDLAPYYSEAWPKVGKMIDDTIEERMLRGGDKIVMTNLDSFLTKDAYSGYINKTDWGYSVRRNFDYSVDRFGGSNAGYINGLVYHGIDLVWFTVDWWEAHRENYPDLFICADCWDWVFRFMIGDENKTKYPIVLHENHKPTREKYFRYREPEYVYNRIRTREWFEGLEDGELKTNIRRLWPMDWYGREAELLRIINETGQNPETQDYD